MCAQEKITVEFFLDRQPPLKRQRFCHAAKERYLSEGGVIVAFGLYLLDQGASSVELHPDGEHGKQFPIRECFESRGFVLEKQKGKTNYGGVYRKGSQAVEVSMRPGLGDVVAEINGQRIVAECKGGIVNTSHAGQLSRLRSGFREVLGHLICREPDAARYVAVMPSCEFTVKFARRIAKRTRAAGIELALVDENGHVSFVQPMVNAAQSLAAGS